jgi:benzoylformate decarboxylase
MQDPSEVLTKTPAAPKAVTEPSRGAREPTGTSQRARSVRDETLDVLRSRCLTTIFSNPGSTEVPFLVDLPDDLRFVLALHEASVVGIATGWALARGEPALALLHTTAGLGNAVAAVATARVNRAPLVIIVGQQDRRHLALEPFLAGRLHGLAGDYPVWFEQPVRPQDVAGALDRAWHEATTARGPAVVIVPMDDWLAPADESHEPAAPKRLLRSAAADRAAVAEVGELLAAARAPALVVGAGADDAETWTALIELSERLGCPVWQEPFGARAGFPQDHPRFVGHLPAERSGVREALSGHDLVLVVGAPVFRQYPYEPGRLIGDSTYVVAVTDDPAEAHRSPADLAILAAPGPFCRALVDRTAARGIAPASATRRPAAPEPPAPDAPLQPGHVFAALAERLPRDAILLEETPSSRAELHRRVPAREPFGFLSAAMGGLGFALPASIGVRMALPKRPVVAVLGDGSSLYTIQALWTAAHYEIGVLFLILRNGCYAVMDHLADRQGGVPPWPAFEEVDVTGLAASFGCPAVRVEGHGHMLEVFDEVLPALAHRAAPLAVEIPVAP